MLEDIKNIVVVRGGGDIATGIIQKLHRTGFKVVVFESKLPSAIRRSVCVSEAVYNSKSRVEDIKCKKAESIYDIEKILLDGQVAIMVDEFCDSLNKINPIALVDAILAKKNLGTKIDMAQVVIGVGPGFIAGFDVNIVIETNRGHNLGRLIFKGEAAPNTGIPGEISGHGSDRVLRAPIDGKINVLKKIGDFVEKGEVLATVLDQNVLATMDGILRGIIPNEYKVFEGMKIGDIDPRNSEKENCFTISDKARAIGGGVLEAILIELKKTEGVLYGE